MQEIVIGLKKIKNQISLKRKEDEKIRELLKKGLAIVFPEVDNLEQFIKDFYIEKKCLFFLTKNKSFASELFLRKNEIIKILGINLVKEIRIK